jgi:hypothetical protein
MDDNSIADAMRDIDLPQTYTPGPVELQLTGQIDQLRDANFSLMNENSSLRENLQLKEETIQSKDETIQSRDQLIHSKDIMIDDLWKRISTPTAPSSDPLAQPAVQPAPFVPDDLDPTSRMKTKNPDVWSGTKSTLPRFLASCRNKFMLEAHNFGSEARKIGFTGSYLGGAPADWWITLFQRYEDAQRNGTTPPVEFTSFAVFSQSLTTTYGDPDLKGTMEHDLCALRQTGSVADYAAEFQRIGNYLSPGWGDEPLLFHFRLHLKDNIKNVLVHEKPYPRTLLEMVAAAIRLDNRESEKIRDRKTMAGYGTAVQSSSSQSRSRQAAGTGQQLTTAPPSQPVHTTPQTAPTVITSPPAASNDGTTPMELDYVGRERKRITNAEKERRRVNKLCMYCGDSGHFRQECPAIPRRAVNLISQTPHSVNYITEIIEPSNATNAYAQE